MDLQTVNAAWRGALNRHDPGDVAACFSVRCQFHDHGTGQCTRGRDAVREGVTEWLNAISELQVADTTFLSSGSRYAKEWTMRGIHTGDLPGLPATGRSFAVHGSGHGEVRDGEIISADLYWNMADFMAQVGALQR